MEFAERIERARSMSLESIMNMYGVQLARRSGDDIVYFCPFHDDTKNPNLYVSRRKNLWNCFACGIGGDSIDFVGTQIYGKGYDRRSFQFKEAVFQLAGRDINTVEVQDVPDKELELPDNFIDKTKRDMQPIDLQYLINRRIFNPYDYNIGAYTHKDNRYITFPVIHDGDIKCVKARRNDLYSKHGMSHYIFPGSDCTYPYTLFHSYHNTVFMFEDIISAISARELGFPAVSLSTRNTIPNKNNGKEKFRQALKDKQVVIIPDNDEPGQNLIQSVKDTGIDILKVMTLPYGKDFNDFVVYDASKAYNFLLRGYWVA